MKTIPVPWMFVFSGLLICSTSRNSLAAVPGLQQQIPAAEYTALVDLYVNGYGSNWRHQEGWMDPAAPEWFGVTVSGCQYDPVTGDVFSVGTVTELDLGEDPGLYGYMQASLGNLVNLRRLSIQGSIGLFQTFGFMGSIPESLGNLTQLEYLDLSRNRMTGYIPPSFANLVNLRFFDIAGNMLGGDLPAALVTFPNLEEVDIRGNCFDIAPGWPVRAIVHQLYEAGVTVLYKSQWQSPNRMPADFNNDGCIDRDDLGYLLYVLRERAGYSDYFDLNADGKLNVADARFVVLHLTNPDGSASPP